MRTRQSQRLRNTVGRRQIALVHFSTFPGLTVLHPRHFGSGKANPRDLRGLPKIYTFVHGSRLAGDRALFSGAHRYAAVVTGERIYDLSAGRADVLGYFAELNRARADQRLIAQGYAGVRVDCDDGRRIVMLFEPLPVVPAARKGCLRCEPDFAAKDFPTTPASFSA